MFAVSLSRQRNRGRGFAFNRGAKVPPSLLLDFMGQTLDSRITVSRGSSKTYFDSSATVQLASSNVLPLDFDPLTLRPRGRRIEEARTNLFLNSLLDGTNLSTQSVAVTAQAYTISFYGTGSITLSGTSSGTINGTGALALTTSTFTPTAGSLTCTVSGTVKWAQIEAGSFATSFIPTAGATVTRAADLASMTGSNFSSWYNNTAGTYLVSFIIPQALATSATPKVFVTSDSVGETNNGDQIFVSQPVGKLVSANTFAATVNAGRIDSAATFSAGTLTKIAYAVAASDRAIAVNGATVVTSASGSRPSSVDRAFIGSGSLGAANFLNGWIQSIAYYPTRLPDSTLQALSV